MSNFASVNDVIDRYHTLTSEEITKAEALLGDISSALRIEARKVGKDLDLEAEKDSDYNAVIKMVTCDIVIRALKESDSNSNLLTQETQSALGYSWSGTYANTGGGAPILKKDLRRLGIRTPKCGVIDFL